MRTVTRTRTILGLFLILVSSNVVDVAAAVWLRCRVDQQMWINGGGDGFGGLGVPGQTFTPTVASPVCKIEIMIHKNIAAAGDLRVSLLGSNFVQLAGGTVTIPAAEIPMGLSVQTID